MNLRTIVLSFAALVLAFNILATDAPENLQRAEPAHFSHVPRQVLAFYYDWYGNPTTTGHWVHWEKVDNTSKTISSTTHFPKLGAYDSHDPKLLDKHCREAKKAGITGFIATWWGKGDFHDQALPLLLDAAQKNGLSVTIYYETDHPLPGESALKPEGAVNDLMYVLEKYGKNPAWLKVDGKPVVFVYGRAVQQLKLPGWLQVINEVDQKYPGGAVFIGDQITKDSPKVFDGIHTYNITDRIAGKTPEQIDEWARVAFPKWVAMAGPDRISCLTIIPGYDDTKTGRPAPRPITERYKGETLRTLFKDAIAANPDWILITSWNEWHEGSEIEPSVENGDTELKVVREFAPKFVHQRTRD